MSKSSLLTVVFVSLLSLSAMAADHVCPAKNAPHARSEQAVTNTECRDAVKRCERNQVGVLNWLTDSHSTPSLHFIDFMEVFMH